MIRKIHLWIGMIGIVLFLLSGQYFQHVLGGLEEIENTPRLLLRSSHIYFFLASIINIVLGLYYIQPQRVKWFTILNQSLIMLAPFFIGYGFIFETITNEGINRDVGSIGLFLIFAWLCNIVNGRVYSFFKHNKALKKDAASVAL